MPTENLIPIDVANQVLATFGITEPSPLYDRRAMPGGFSMNDLHEVLSSESPFIFGIDWRAVLPDELEPIAAALSELGASIKSEVANECDEGWISCDGKRERVKYVPSDDDDFTEVMIALQRIVPATIEFREATSNGQNDGWEFSALLREEWSVLETLDRDLIHAMFRPLSLRKQA